ncbi:Hpt domain-containing protein [Sulfuriflexus mobilis]|uniref:Hpt domain-containing protein n=1 Tax=Sulfuriflexus mobilis TaxID=1811807 RepID=UPI000F839AD3|nr:Hpt domain-containing protein [Sulfuriflexus mobilis]
MVDKSKTPSPDVSKMLALLRADFVTELPSRLGEVEGIILELEKSAAFTEQYESLYRHVHSIKGSAGTHGLPIISTVCHALEDEIVKVEDKQSLLNHDKVVVWLRFIDVLRQTLDLINTGGEDFTVIEDELDKLRGKGCDYQFSGLLVMAPGLHQQMCISALDNDTVTLSFAESGYHALGRLLHENFDFIISNMELPDLNGFAMITALRLSKRRNHNIPSVLLTSKDLESCGRDSDPDYVIKKDANMSTAISQTVEKIIKTQHSQ